MSENVETPRSVGPVTLATSGSVAVVTVVCWVVSLFGIDVPNEIQGALSILVALAAGYAVKPGNGRRRAS